MSTDFDFPLVNDAPKSIEDNCMEQYPEISYTHVLSELSVNRKDPCEVIRELISNSYDASASKIEIYPLLQYEGFIFFDNGVGLNEVNEINGITPYRAFFSIGKSTKIKGDYIGYKCQGSKLCFASGKFTLITRCKDEENWRFISIDNPKVNLNPQYNIQTRKDSDPWNTLNNLFPQADNRTKAILAYLKEGYLTESFCKGTMIIVQSLEVERFSYFYGTDGPDGKEDFSYIKNYIRFNTRHGDMRILRAEKTGFPPNKAKNFQNSPGYNDECDLYLWTKGQLKKLESGYPYLEKPDDLYKLQIKSPSNVSRLRSGNFYSRGAATFSFDGRTYCLALAIDGNGRSLEKYEELDRQGPSGKRSGIRLTDQRGTFICSDGVRICSFNEIFEHSKLEDYAVLGTGNAQTHYIFMIDGSFDVVTNRNSLSEAALKIIKNDVFVDKIKQFFDQAKKDQVFSELLTRLKKESQAYRIDAYTKQLNDLKDSIKHRSRFMVQDIEQLMGKWLVEPCLGEEHWVGALYTMFAHLVPLESPYTHLWMRPRTFSGVGIDSIAVKLTENSLAANVHKGLEYKYTFSSSEEFNHPLIEVEQIVCWEKPTAEKDQIRDSYGYFGYIAFPEEIDGIGYEITDIQSLEFGGFNGGTIKVISLKQLLNKTFSCQWETPPPKATASQKGSGKGKLRGSAK